MPKISKSLLLTILLVLSLLVVGVLSYNSINSPKTSIIEQKPTSSQSSVATSSSSKNQLAISASSITTNTSGYSSVVSGSSAVGTSSTTSQDSVIAKLQPSSNCNLPDGENIVKTEVGCFEMVFWIDGGGIFKGDCISKCAEEQNKNKLFKSNNNFILLTKIGKDYFSKIIGTSVTKDISVLFYNPKKIEKGFEIDVSYRDFEYYNQFDQITKDNNPFGLRKNAVYQILVEGDVIYFKFISINQ